MVLVASSSLIGRRVDGAHNEIRDVIHIIQPGKCCG